MRRAFWTTEARNDVQLITDYHASAAPEFPPRLLRALDNMIARLLINPGLGVAVRRLRCRKLRVARTRYLLFYRLREDRVEILRVVHAARDWRLVL